MPRIVVEFKNMLNANKAVSELKKMGYKDAHTDAVERYLSEYSEEINFTGSGTVPSLSAPVLKSNGHIYQVGKTPLIAADPLLRKGSGMDLINETENIYPSVYLSVNVKDTDKENMEALIKQYDDPV